MWISNFTSKQPVPHNNELPKWLLYKIQSWSRTNSQLKVLEHAFNFVATNFYGHRCNILIKINRLFIKDVDLILNTKGFHYCTTMNYLMRVILINSLLFEDEDIKLKWTNTWYIFPHQYLEVKVGNEILSIDVWNYQFGVKFGDVGSGFKTMKCSPNIKKANE